MYNFEKDMSVSEIKGLLAKLEGMSYDARFDLAFDNIEDLLKTTSLMRAIIDRIENKIKDQITEEDDDMF